MKRLLAFFVTLAVGVAMPAAAHSPLKTSFPTDGSVGPAPASFVLTFAHSARLTSLQVKGVAGASPVRGLPKSAAETHTIPAPMLAPGRYKLLFRAVADDGHVMSGTVHFTVSAGSGSMKPRP